MEEIYKKITEQLETKEKLTPNNDNQKVLNNNIENLLEQYKKVIEQSNQIFEQIIEISNVKKKDCIGQGCTISKSTKKLIKKSTKKVKN
jgi:hypothetical protein